MDQIALKYKLDVLYLSFDYSFLDICIRIYVCIYIIIEPLLILHIKQMSKMKHIFSL